MAVGFVSRAAAIAMVVATAGAGALFVATHFRIGDTYEWDQAIEAVVVAWRHGQPLYPPKDLGPIYALPYGPLHFLYLAGFDRLAEILNISMGGLNLALTLLVPFAILGALTLRHGEASIGLRIFAAGAAGLLAAFATRFHVGLQSTPFLCLLLAIALAVPIRADDRRIWPGVALGMIFGALAATKATAPLYLFPVLVSGLSSIGSARQWPFQIFNGVAAAAVIVAVSFFLPTRRFRNILRS